MKKRAFFLRKIPHFFRYFCFLSQDGGTMPIYLSKWRKYLHSLAIGHTISTSNLFLTYIKFNKKIAVSQPQLSVCITQNAFYETIRRRRMFVTFSLLGLWRACGSSNSFSKIKLKPPVSINSSHYTNKSQDQKYETHNQISWEIIVQICVQVNENKFLSLINDYSNSFLLQ